MLSLKLKNQAKHVMVLSTLVDITILFYLSWKLEAFEPLSSVLWKLASGLLTKSRNIKLITRLMSILVLKIEMCKFPDLCSCWSRALESPLFFTYSNLAFYKGLAKVPFLQWSLSQFCLHWFSFETIVVLFPIQLILDFTCCCKILLKIII